MDCKKDIFYRFMNNPGIDWRKLLYYLNLQLWSKIKVRSEHKSENACLIVDDTDYPKNGRRTENIGRVYSQCTEPLHPWVQDSVSCYHRR